MYLMLHEKTRTYFFPNKIEDQMNHEVTVQFVTEVKVSDSGGHRLTCKYGKLVYIPTGWLAIEIETDHGWEL